MLFLPKLQFQSNQEKISYKPETTDSVDENQGHDKQGKTAKEETAETQQVYAK